MTTSREDARPRTALDLHAPGALAALFARTKAEFGGYKMEGETEQEQDKDKEKALTFTHSETVSRMEEITEAVKRISKKEKRSEQDENYLADLNADFTKLNEHRATLEAAEAAARMEHTVGRVVRGRNPGQGGSESGLRTEGGSTSRSDYDRDAILEPDSIEDKRFRNPWDLREVRTYGRDPGKVAEELHSRSLAAVEKMPGANDKIRGAATKLIEQYDDEDSNLARLALTISSPTYLRAWSKMAVNPLNADLTTEERMALNESKTVQRAMSLNDPSGGYLVPFQLDPTVILTSDGSYNEIRQIARQVVASATQDAEPSPTTAPEQEPEA